MKNLSILFFIIISFNFLNLAAQDETWFKEITEEAGLSGMGTSKIQCCDINGDDYPDLLLGTGGLIPGHSSTFTLLLNVENPDSESPNRRIFVDVTEESGINAGRDLSKPYREYDVAVFADIDNDGDRDLITSFYYHRLEWFNPGHNDRSEVYLNDGTGKFTLYKNSGLNDHRYYFSLDPGMIDAVGLSYLDYDYDGILDLYIATKFVDYRAGVFFPDILMKGNGDGSFTEVKDNGVQAKNEPLYGVNVTDWNNDGWQDVITSPYCRTSGRLLKNMKDGTFLDVQKEVGYSSQKHGGDWYQNPDNGQWMQQPLCQWEAPTADFDNDGDMDLLQVLVHGGFETRFDKPEGRTHVTVNQGPPDYKLEWDMDLIHRNEPTWTHLGDFGGLWTDFDNDGWTDMCIFEGHYVEQTIRAYFLMQNPDDNHFYDVTSDLGLMDLKDAAQGISADIDLDGDKDIFVMHNDNGTPRLRLFRNDIGNKSNWISTKLIAPEGSNKDAMGARITVHSGTNHQIREIQAGLGHFGGQDPFIKNFGIGNWGRVDSITVRWPKSDLQTTVVRDPMKNVIIEIDEDGFVDYLNTWDEPSAVIQILQEDNYARFDTVNVGEQKEVDFSIKNIGNKPLSISEAKLVADDGEIFEMSGFQEIPVIIPEGELQVFTGRFTPKDRKWYRAQAIFTCNAVNAVQDEYSVDLEGYGYTPEPFLVLNTKELFFEDGYADREDTQTITLENIGELPMQIDSIKVIEDEFAVFSVGDYPETIEAKQDIEVDVKFLPHAKNQYTGRIAIYTNSFNMKTAYIDLSGIADGPIAEIAFDKMLLQFGKVPVGQSKLVEMSIINEGDADLEIRDIAFEEYKDVFDINIEEFPETISPESQLEFSINFTPKENQRYNTKMLITSNAYLDSLRDIAILAFGDEPASVEISTSSDGLLQLSASPNPASDMTLSNIIINSDDPEYVEMEIIDMSGRKVMNLYSGTVNSGTEVRADISGLSSGSYFIIARTDKSKVALPLSVIR